MPAHDKELKRRASDDPAIARKLANEVRYQRKRTIVISVVAAGLVSLFIGRAIEVQGQNDQVNRSRTNCQLTQDDRLDRLDALRESAAASAGQADNTLGNTRPMIYVPPKGDNVVGTIRYGKRPIPPADFNKPPFNAFKDFKALIVAQAKGNRAAAARNLARAKKLEKRLEKCNKVFPKKKPFWIF